METIDYTIKIASSGPNWESIIVGAVTIISSFIVASYAANKALKNSYSKAWWDKKEKIYGEIIRDFSKLSITTNFMAFVLADGSLKSNTKIMEKFDESNRVFIELNKEATQGLDNHGAYVDDSLLKYYHDIWSLKHSDLLNEWSENTRIGNAKSASESLNNISMHYNDFKNKSIDIRNYDLKINQSPIWRRIWQRIEFLCDEDSAKFK